MWLFTKEAAYGIVRTVASFVYGWLIALAPPVEEFFMDLNFSEEGMVVVLGSALYILIRAIAEKVPLVGRLLIFNKAPDYGV